MIRKIGWTRMLAFLLLAACSSSSSSGDASKDGGAVADSSEDAAPGIQAIDGGSSALDQAEGYATGNIACTSAAACCVVFDECKNQGLVIGAADKDKVASLCSEYDQYEDGLASGGSCTGCIPPPIQVSCVAGKCTGTALPFLLPDGGAVDPSLSQNHCGGTSDFAGGRSGSILGC